MLAPYFSSIQALTLEALMVGHAFAQYMFGTFYNLHH
jgi:hypothetical protein